jgi:hypothetical protein
LALAIRTLGLVAFREGDLDRATELLIESLSSLETPGDPWFVTRGLESLASVAAARGECMRAARLLGAGAALRGKVGEAVLPFHQPAYDETLARIQAALDPGAASTAWRDGGRMRLEQALAYPVSTASEPPPNPLSQREREVLDLLARGLSNRRSRRSWSLLKDRRIPRR